MASLWEILDPSSLRYNTSLGLTEADSGSGPPTFVNGGVRTGGVSLGDVVGAGHPNCMAWTTSATNNAGTTEALSPNWDDRTDVFPIHPWVAFDNACRSALHVWCVAD